MNVIKRYAVCVPIALALVITFFAYSCHPSEESHTVGQDAVSVPESERLALSATQMKAVNIQIDTIARKNMHAVVTASGQLAVPPQNKADVNVLIGGIINKIYVQEGEVVKQGQVLALLENQDLIKLQRDYLTAKSTFVFTQEERQRQQELRDAHAGVGKNLQRIEASFNTEQAKILTLKKELEVLGIRPESTEKGNIVNHIAIRAPINGTVGHIYVNTGTYASTDKSLMDIIDNSKVHADLIVFEKDLFKVKVGQKIRFVLTNQDNREISGKIYGINKSFEDRSKGIIVHATIKNAKKSQLIPGMYVRGLIDIGNQTVPVVPEDAVVHSEGKDFIFVVDSTRSDAKTTSFWLAEIIPGIRELGYVQITPVKQLAPGTKVVVKGAFYLLSAEKVTQDDDE